MSGLNKRLAEQINELHRAAQSAASIALQHAQQAGQLLIQAKRQCGHGKWDRWLSLNFEGSSRTARAYMLVAKRLPQLSEAKRQRVANLSLREALSVLREPKATKEAVPDELTEAMAWAAEVNERLKTATLEECQAIIADATQRHQQAMEEKLRAEREAGRILNSLESKGLTFTDTVGGLPELIPGQQYLCFVEGGDELLELRPSADHPGYYYTARYTGLRGEGQCSVDYTKRPLLAKSKFFEAAVRRAFGGRIPADPWFAEAVEPGEPWYVTDPLPAPQPA